MQPPLPTIPQPEPENKCPDCLYLHLDGFPLPSKRFLDKFPFMPKAASKQLDLYLTIQFNEQWEPILGGRVKFGIKGGELRLKLRNCELPWTSRELGRSLALSVDEDQSSDRVAAAESQLGVIALTTQKTEGTTAQFPFSACKVITKGSQENPAWVFEVETGKPVLKGLLKRVKLGTVNVTAKSCRIEATFEVSKQEVHLLDAEGLWSEDNSRNKRAVLQRTIALHLIESKLRPYLSRVQLQYD